MTMITFVWVMVKEDDTDFLMFNLSTKPLKPHSVLIIFLLIVPFYSKN